MMSEPAPEVMGESGSAGISPPVANGEKASLGFKYKQEKFNMIN